MLRSVINNQLICGVAIENKKLLTDIIALFESKILVPVIDRVYPLEKIVDAHRYVDQGHKKGNVVLIHENHKARN